MTDQTTLPAFLSNKWMPLIPLVVIFSVCGGIYAQATPILEASDELWHFGMVDFIADNGRLPVQDPDVETLYRQEGSQPPLYYGLAALIVGGVDRGDFEAIAKQANPHALVGVPGAVGNKNMLLHDRLNPARVGTVQAVMMLRWFSIGLGVITVSGLYAAGLSMGGRGYALLAAGIAAFNPMFLFITASVNNDNLVTALNSLVIWQLMVMGWQGFGWRRSVFIAVVTALASLSKLSGNVLYPVIGLAGLYVYWQTRDRRGLITLGVMIVVAWGSIAGWWYWRNIQLYGELFGTAMMVEVAGRRLEPFTIRTLITEFEGFRVSYWGLFGGVNVLTFRWFYWLADALVIAAVIGLFGIMANVAKYPLRSIRRYRRVFGVTDALNLYWLYGAGISVVLFVTALLSVIAWTAQTYASQGRLLFPFIAANSLLLASGLRYLMKRYRPGAAGAVLVGVMAVIALVIPFTSIRQAYMPPPTVTELPERARPVYARFDQVALVGYELDDQRYETGDVLPVTVYWEVLAAADRDLSAYLVAVDPAGNPVGKVDTYPGGGTLRTSTWEAGAIYADTYAVPIDPRTGGHFDLRLQVGWWHYPTEQIVIATDSDDLLLESVMLDAGGFASRVVPNLSRFVGVSGARFGNQIELIGYRQRTVDRVELAWRVLDPPEGEHRVFLHVIAGGELVGQADAAPALSVEYWERHDLFVTTHDLQFERPLELGRYQLLAGWYNPDDRARLPLRDDRDNAYAVGTFTIP